MSIIETAWRYFLVYRGLNLHYKDGSKYDYGRYGPLSKGADPEKFEYSPERFVFIKLAKVFPTEDQYIDYLGWQALRNGKVPFHRSLGLEPDIREFKDTFLKTKLSLAYNFERFLDTLKIEDLQTNGVDRPKVLDMYLAGDLHPDFYYILDRTLDLTRKYLEIFHGDLLLQSKMNKYLRYRLLARVPEFEKIQLVLRKVLKEKQRGNIIC